MSLKYKDEDGNVVAVVGGGPAQTFDPTSNEAMSGIAIAQQIPFKLAIDEEGNYGYIKEGEDTITPFGKPADEPVWIRPTEWPNLDILPIDSSVVYITVDNSDRKCSFAYSFVSATKNTIVEIGDIIDGEFTAIKTVSLSKVDGWSPTVDFWADVDIDYPVVKATAASGITNLNTLAPYLEDGTKAGTRAHSRALEIYIAVPELPKASYIGSGITQHIKFINCQSITSFNRGFIDATGLKLIEFENCDLTKFNNCEYMLQGCASLLNVDFIKDMDFSLCTAATNMFSYCRSLVTLDLSEVKGTDNITTWTGFIGNCSSLQSVNLKGVVKQATSLTSFMGGCTVIESLDMSDCDVSGVTSITNFMTSTTKFKYFKVPKGFSMNFSLNAQNRTDIMRVANQLETTTLSPTLTLGANPLKLLSTADKAFITQKGWTLA